MQVWNKLYTYTGARKVELESPLENIRKEKSYKASTVTHTICFWTRLTPPTYLSTAHMCDITIGWSRPHPRHPRTELC